MKNFLAFIFGFLLVFGLVGRSYSSSLIGSPIGFVFKAEYSTLNNTYLPPSADINPSLGNFKITGAWQTSLQCGPYPQSMLDTPFIYGTVNVITSASHYCGSGYAQVRNYATIVSTTDPVTPVCPADSLSGDYTVPGKDMSFSYCFNDCSLDSSGVLYDSINDRTIFHGSANGDACTSGTSASPYVAPSPVVPTCPDGQIYDPLSKTCVPISSGTGTATAPTDTTFPDSSPTYNPGVTGYGTPTLPVAPTAVTGPQTTTSGTVGTTTTVVNPDGSVTETTNEEKTVDPLAAPDGQSISYNKPSKSVNFQNFNNALNGFAQGGPVRFFSDMTQVFQSIVATPAAPVFRLPLPGHTMVVDLSVFDPVAQISRIMLSIFALVALGFFLLKQWRAG